MLIIDELCEFWVFIWTNGYLFDAVRLWWVVKLDASIVKLTAYRIYFSIFECSGVGNGMQNLVFIHKISLCIECEFASGSPIKPRSQQKTQISMACEFLILYVHWLVVIVWQLVLSFTCLLMPNLQFCIRLWCLYAWVGLGKWEWGGSSDE